MKTIYYDSKDQNISGPVIFLAGPTIRDGQYGLISWRKEALQLLEAGRFAGTIIVPEFMDSFPHKNFDCPSWELDFIKKSDCVLFWVARTQELLGLTTNCEFGFLLAKDPLKMVYGRPNDAYRVSYLDYIWDHETKERFGRSLKKYSCLELATISAIITAEANRLRK